jgi:hypothetical protein
MTPAAPDTPENPTTPIHPVFLALEGLDAHVGTPRRPNLRIPLGGAQLVRMTHVVGLTPGSLTIGPDIGRRFRLRLTWTLSDGRKASLSNIHTEAQAGRLAELLADHAGGRESQP